MDALDILGTQHLGLFIVTGLLLNMTPGQDTVYILGRTLSSGRSAGVMSVLGISAGCLIHTLLAALGLSAILAASATAFLVVKYAGAAYLIWLGARMLAEARDPSAAIRSFEPEGPWAIFRAGLLTNVLNPKVALFFMAFLPQFVSPHADSRVLTLLFLGLGVRGERNLVVPRSGVGRVRTKRAPSHATRLGNLAQTAGRGRVHRPGDSAGDQQIVGRAPSTHSRGTFSISIHTGA